jgi:NAD-dependent dihydropyrimidine dehydrogenase PreA subunit
MAEQLHVVDAETRLGDGICAEVCPEDILELVDEKVATVDGRADACILCAQCVAVCPTESLTMFHGNRWTMSYEENAHLVCHHSMLAALSLGLGSTIIGLIPPVVDRSKFLRDRYGIPKDNKVLTSLVLGYPKYKYRCSIRRDLAGVKFH